MVALQWYDAGQVTSGTDQGEGGDTRQFAPGFERETIYSRPWLDELGFPKALDPQALDPASPVADVWVVQQGEGGDSGTWMPGSLTRTYWESFRDREGLHQKVATYKNAWVVVWVDGRGIQRGSPHFYPQSVDALFGLVSDLLGKAFLGFVGGAAFGSASAGSAEVASAPAGGYDVLFDDLDVTDVVDFPAAVDLSDVGSFDSFAYSSGEAISAGTDASNVDFGFGQAPENFGIDGEANTYPSREDFRASEIAEQNYGVTPESTVSDYGSVSAEQWRMDELAKDAKTLTTAVKLSKGAPTPAKTGQTSGGGALSALVQGLFGTPAQAKPPTRSNVGTSSTAMQQEGAQPRSFWGQLTGNAVPGGAGAAAGMIPLLALLLGGGLVVYAVLKR